MSSDPDGRRPGPRSRRRWLIGGSAAALLSVGACSALRFWPEQGFRNECRAQLPAALHDHPHVRSAWDGIDPVNVWDTHVHLVGTGDSGSGIYVNPEMSRPANPLLYARYLFYLNAGCVHDAPGRIDQTFAARLLNLVEAMRPGFKAVLFAFDCAVDAQGRELLDQTMFKVPDAYAASVARANPTHFEWAASIHPYRTDALERLTHAVQNGARAVKWLPNAMLIDPAAARCDAFYAAMARFGMPLITHAGYEQAVHSPEGQAYGNPLRLRRALDQGVKVIVAHCASLGDDVDLDVGPDGPRVPSFALFRRLMSEERYRGRLYGDVSAMILRNRVGPSLAEVIEQTDWHDRLVHGSDYPLPGILPVVSIDGLVRDGFLSAEVVPVLREVRQHNPLMFDFLLKRHLRWGGRRLSNSVFETRALFAAAPGRGI